MRYSEACAIFENIDTEEFTDEEKSYAIYMVMHMPTHNSITKKAMLAVIKWLFYRAFDVEVADGRKESTD